MNSLIKKIVRRSLQIAAVLLILFAIFITVLRGLTPLLSHHKDVFERWIASVFELPVSIGQVEASWHATSPQFNFQNVVIYSSDHKHVIARVHQVQVGLKIIKTLLERRLEPGIVMMVGAKVDVWEHKNGQVTMISEDTDEQSSGQAKQMQKTPLALKSVAQWLLSQKEIGLSQLSLKLHTKRGKVIKLRRVKLILRNEGSHHRLVGRAHLQQAVATRIKFIVEAHGQINSHHPMYVNAYVDAQDVLLAQWLRQGYFNGYHITQGLGNIHLWASWRSNEPLDLQSQLQLNNINIQDKDNKHSLLIEDLAGNFAFTMQHNLMWRFAADKVTLALSQKQIPMLQFAIAGTSDQHAEINVKQIQIGYLPLSLFDYVAKQHVILPPQWQQAYQHLRPQGELYNVDLMRNKTKDLNKRKWNLQTQFRNLAWRAWQHLPAVKALDGSIVLHDDSGRLKVDSHNSDIDLPNYLGKPLHLQRLMGLINWRERKDGLRITGTQLLVSDNKLAVAGDAQFWIPRAKSGMQANMLLGYTAQDLSQLKYYYPHKLMPPELVSWLNSALPSGAGLTGTLVLRGNLKHFPFKQKQGVFISVNNLNDISFRLDKDWPLMKHLFGVLRFDGDAVHANIISGQVYSSHIRKISATIPQLGTRVKQRLNASGTLDGDLTDALEFVHQSPIKQSIGDYFTNLTMSGPAQLTFHLSLPVAYQGRRSVKGNVILQGNHFALSPWHLNFNDLKGEVQFNNNNVQAKQLSGRLNDEPVKLMMKTLPQKKQAPITRIQLNSTLKMAQLKKYTGLNLLAKVTGKTQYQATLDLKNKNNQMHGILNVSSNLQGVDVDLPPPLAKTTEQTVPFGFKFHFGSGLNKTIFITYGNKASAALRIHDSKNGNSSLQAGELHIGSAKASVPDQPGLFVKANLASFDWQTWQPLLVLQPLSKKQGIGESRSLALAKIVRKLELVTPKLHLFHSTFTNADVSLTSTENALQAHVKSTQVLGDITVGRDVATQGITARLQKLHVSLPTNKPGEKVLVLPPAAKIPPLDIVIDDTVIGHNAYGKLTLQTLPSSDGLQIKNLQLESPLFYLTAKGDWRGQADKQSTSIAGTFLSKDVGALLESWDITDDIQSKSSRIVFAFNWQAAPFALTLDKLNGTTTLQLKRGRLVDVSDDTAAKLDLGKIVNIFSLQTLSRRLSLDFSDLTKKGFSFNNLSGSFNIFAGDANTQDLKIDAPVAKVKITGRIGLAKSDMDLLMHVTPDVTSSLPVIATVAGSAVLGPFGVLIGASTWVANKIIVSPELAKVTTYSYKVQGPWAAPKITELGNISKAKKQQDTHAKSSILQAEAPARNHALDSAMPYTPRG